MERLRSRVRVSVREDRRRQRYGDNVREQAGRTLCSKVEIDGLSNRDVDDAEEPLVLLLELFLVKDLNRYDRRVFDFDVERLVPVCTDARDREGREISTAPLSAIPASPSCRLTRVQSFLCDIGGVSA